MNANELADLIEGADVVHGANYVMKAATMLRQQQAEIEALKADMRMLLKEYHQYWSDQQ